ncbi:cell division control protein 24, partial [Tremellales sp. Uapishka_1]
MSMSGSITRKRVGSLSQRGNDSSLPPLDIQSIQMPMHPQNALALKTAALSSTRSLYQTCSTLRKRLRCVEEFAPFLEQPPGAEPLDVVSHACHTLRLGSSLCHLYNLLIPSFTNPSSRLYADMPAPNQILYDFPNFYESPDGVRDWARRPENIKMCKKYIALFCMAMAKRREEGRWPGELWAVHELMGNDTTGRDDTTGIMKVLHTVETILDHLPESALTPASPSTPYTSSSSQNFAAGSGTTPRALSRQSYDIPFSMGGTGPGMTAVSTMAATMNGGVHIRAQEEGPGLDMQRKDSETSADTNAFKSVEELVASEKTYVQELEVLQRCSKELLQAQLVTPDAVHKMFSNLANILDFHRRFLIQLETQFEPVQEGRGPKAWAEGRWGYPFVTLEKEFAIYGPYCANYLEAITVVNEQMPNLLRGQELPENERPCLEPERELQAFMIKPIQRITKYGLLLDAVLHATAKYEYPYRAELEAGHAAVRRIAAEINEVTDHKAKQATVRELVERVEDWKGHELHKFGDLYLDDHFTVSKADQPREYHIFLFEKMMLCCKEVPLDRKDKKSSKNSSMLRKEKTASKSSALKRPLALKGRIFVSNIRDATMLPPSPSDPYGIPRVAIIWTVPQKHPSGYPEEVEDSFIMSGKSEDQMKKWRLKVVELVQQEKRRAAELAESRINGRYSNSQGTYRALSPSSQFPPPTPWSEQPPFGFPMSASNSQLDDEDDDPSGLRSGRTTPSLSGHSSVVAHPTTGRRVQSQQTMPPDRQAEFRARALTEDSHGPSMAQWRNQHPGVGALQPPPLPRLTSNMSAMSVSSESSFGNAPLRSARQMSQSRLGRAEEMDEESEYTHPYARYGPSRGMARAPSHGITPSVPHPHPPPLRSRSASSPNVYQAPAVSPAPPLPYTASSHWTGEPSPPTFSSPTSNVLGTSSSSTLVGGTAYFAKRMSGGKRSSGGSHSTETSETSSQSPATPYASVPGEPRGPTPISRQGSQDTNPGLGMGAKVLAKVQYREDQFSIGVTSDISFRSLQEKVMKKIRICTGRTDAMPFRLRWLDTDGDQIALSCDSDIQTMFGECKENGMVHVQLLVI